MHGYGQYKITQKMNIQEQVSPSQHTQITSRNVDHDDEVIFRSVWLCNDDFINSLQPTMDELSKIEFMRNNHNTVSFLPHVTLFSGNVLTKENCTTVMKDFKNFFPNGLQLKIDSVLHNKFSNPPIQLLMKTINEEDNQSLQNFEHHIKKNRCIDISFNLQWLHASLLYKFTDSPILDETIETCKNSVNRLIGTTYDFNKFATTTGLVFNINDVKRWNNQEIKTLRLNNLKK